jgi:two-component system, chemotaxis family, protein-glutamate methylesterase/glutaminase
MSLGRAARVLIVDDSVVMRSLLRQVLSADSRIEIAGTASDGQAALRLMESIKPDLVLLDIEMPGMDGLTALERIRAKDRRIPIIMCSTLTSHGASVTIEALARGASDYVTKPSGPGGREEASRKLQHDLVPKILALTGQTGMPRAAVPSPLAPVPRPHSVQPVTGTPSVVVIGVSTGGPAALDVLLTAIPAGFPLPILLVQHMPQLFTRMLAERLDSRCPLHICEAETGDLVVPGKVYIARGDWHMELVSDRLKHGTPEHRKVAVRLTQGPLENHCRPAVDVLFRSAAEIYGNGTLAVMLTGMGSDGLEGCRKIRALGGTVLAQNQETSAVWGMPGAVVHAGLAQRVLPLSGMAPEIIRLCSSRNQREAHTLRESTV